MPSWRPIPEAYPSCSQGVGCRDGTERGRIDTSRCGPAELSSSIPRLVNTFTKSLGSRGLPVTFGLSRLYRGRPPDERTLLLSVVLAIAVVFPPAANATTDIELTFPQEVAMTQFTSSFGAARGARSHQGNDLMAPKMTEVYAAADGIVTWIREGGSAGRYVVIAHADDWETSYMHLNNDTPGTDDGRAPSSLGVPVAEGDVVEAGDLIGWVGDSGNAEASSPHTHFELHHNGRPVDPFSHLMDAYQRAIEEEVPLPIGDMRPL